MSTETAPSILLPDHPPDQRLRSPPLTLHTSTSPSHNSQQTIDTTAASDTDTTATSHDRHSSQKRGERHPDGERDRERYTVQSAVNDTRIANDVANGVPISSVANATRTLNDAASGIPVLIAANDVLTANERANETANETANVIPVPSATGVERTAAGAEGATNDATDPGATGVEGTANTVRLWARRGPRGWRRSIYIVISISIML